MMPKNNNHHKGKRDERPLKKVEDNQDEHELSSMSHFNLKVSTVTTGTGDGKGLSAQLSAGSTSFSTANERFFTASGPTPLIHTPEYTRTHLPSNKSNENTTAHERNSDELSNSSLHLDIEEAMTEDMERKKVFTIEEHYEDNKHSSSHDPRETSINTQTDIDDHEETIGNRSNLRKKSLDRRGIIQVVAKDVEEDKNDPSSIAQSLLSKTKITKPLIEEEFEKEFKSTTNAFTSLFFSDSSPRNLSPSNSPKKSTKVIESTQKNKYYQIEHRSVAEFLNNYTLYLKMISEVTSKDQISIIQSLNSLDEFTTQLSNTLISRQELLKQQTEKLKEIGVKINTNWTESMKLLDATLTKFKSLEPFLPTAEHLGKHSHQDSKKLDEAIKFRSALHQGQQTESEKEKNDDVTTNEHAVDTDVSSSYSLNNGNCDTKKLSPSAHSERSISKETDVTRENVTTEKVSTKNVEKLQNIHKVGLTSGGTRNLSPSKHPYPLLSTLYAKKFLPLSARQAQHN